MSDKKIAVVLAEGATVADYNPKDYPDAFVLGVNTTHTTYKKLTRRDAKLDAVICMDRPKDFRKVGKFDNLLKVPKGVQMILHWMNQWEGIATQQGWDATWLNSSKIPDTRPDLWDKWEYVHGSFSVTAAVYYAIKKGFEEIHVFGHDLDPGWNMYNKSTVSRAIKEINFATLIMEKKKQGKLFLSAGSNLWNEKTDKGDVLACDKIAKKKIRKKKDESVDDSAKEE